jgi:hypothetical protein
MAPSSDRRAWQPARTWVLAVGTIVWADSESFPSFPQALRRDLALVEFFRASGVPDGQIAYLQDEQATTAGIHHALATHFAGSREGDWLMLYFCGHGGKHDNGAAYFASYDTGVNNNRGWLVASIPAALERHFGGTRAVLMADCCYSGSLAESVGRHDGRLGYACLTSSLASESSTGNWTFTEGLLAGLEGQAFVDADGDHWVTWQELARQIAQNMAFAEEQLSSFAVSGGFDPHAVAAPARPRPDPRVGGRVEVLSEEEWYPAQIQDVQDGELLVHYFGYPVSDDEWVTTEQIRTPVRPTYAVGTPVEVRWKTKWYPAHIVYMRDGVHQIHYDDFDSEWDEWASLSRIRPR